jgi:hypothetical protein
VERRGGPWLLRLLRRGWVRAGELATDHTRSVLILSVFAFKVGWGQCNEELRGMHEAVLGHCSWSPAGARWGRSLGPPCNSA